MIRFFFQFPAACQNIIHMVLIVPVYRDHTGTGRALFQAIGKSRFQRTALSPVFWVR